MKCENKLLNIHFAIHRGFYVYVRVISVM